MLVEIVKINIFNFYLDLLYGILKISLMDFYLPFSFELKAFHYYYSYLLLLYILEMECIILL